MEGFWRVLMQKKMGRQQKEQVLLWNVGKFCMGGLWKPYWTFHATLTVICKLLNTIGSTLLIRFCYKTTVVHFLILFSSHVFISLSRYKSKIMWLQPARGNNNIQFSDNLLTPTNKIKVYVTPNDSEHNLYKSRNENRHPVGIDSHSGHTQLR